MSQSCVWRQNPWWYWWGMLDDYQFLIPCTSQRWGWDGLLSWDIWDFAHIQLNSQLHHVGFVTYQKNEDVKKYQYGTVGVSWINNSSDPGVQFVVYLYVKTQNSKTADDLWSGYSNCRCGGESPTSTFIFLREILNCKQNDVVRQRNAVLNCFKPPAFKFRTNKQCGNISGWAVCNAAWNIFWSNKKICTFTYFDVILCYFLGFYIKNHETSID